MNIVFDLIPNNGRKSFYGKAKVRIEEDGSQTLLSFDSEIINRKGNIVCRLYDGDLSHTSSIHLKSFCGLSKKDFDQLDVGNSYFKSNLSKVTLLFKAKSGLCFLKQEEN